MPPTIFATEADAAARASEVAGQSMVKRSQTSQYWVNYLQGLVAEEYWVMELVQFGNEKLLSTALRFSPLYSEVGTIINAAGRPGGVHNVERIVDILVGVLHQHMEHRWGSFVLSLNAAFADLTNGSEQGTSVEDLTSGIFGSLEDLEKFTRFKATLIIETLKRNCAGNG